jgi:diguanylate cyclase (GGDEF)-like protein
MGVRNYFLFGEYMERLGEQKEVLRIRLALIIGALLITLFVITDLDLLSASQHSAYLQNRFLIQIPLILVVFAFSFTPYFLKIKHVVFASIMVALTFANYHVIYLNWHIYGFAFPYEGTILYAFYCVFALGLAYQLALVASVLCISGFIVLMIEAPAYGDRVMISIAFVAASLFICAYAKYRLDKMVLQLTLTNKKLNTLSREDALTGLLNRRALMKESERMAALCERQHISFSLFMMDLDHFKYFNDAFGHQKGDEAIVTHANIMRAVFQRKADILGRYGGEEFMVVVSGQSKEDVEQCCQQALTKWKEAALHQAEEAPSQFVSCSIGAVFVSNMRGHSLDTLIKHADEALYKAKHAGRNTYVVSTLP